MPTAQSGRSDLLWSDFQSTFTEFSGISIQAFDNTGVALHSFPRLPTLCSFFQRYPEMHAACQKDCFSKAVACRDSRKTIATRCYAGLSYRVVPIRRRNRLQSVIIVGRVLTDVFGGEQCLGFIERYKLSAQSFMESLAGVRSLGSSELDRVAGFVRRMAASFVAADSQLARRRFLLDRKQKLIDFAGKTTAFHERGPGKSREVLEFLGRMFATQGSVILLAGEEPDRFSVHSSQGLGEESLHLLANQDWPRIFQLHARDGCLNLSQGKDILRAGLDGLAAPLVVQRLDHGSHTAGYLVLSGAALNARDLKMLDTAAAFVATRLVHQRCRERAEQKDEEARLLGLMAEKCLTAQSVEELLPLALEAAMLSLGARRGSIILADEERGRITARALRGDHATISDTIESLQPGSVSHRVFYDRRPLLVRDTGNEPGLESDRQFPYATRSFVSVPLRENGHALGVLHLTEREGEGAFTPADLSFLETLGLQASSAIRKARLEEEVRSLQVTSSTDHLTGVYNRRYLEEHLATEIQRSNRFNQPLAVAMLDLDGFKALNDELGHEAGDQVLREVASTIGNQLRAVDILARYGGDEFVLVLPGAGAAGALQTIEKICARIEREQSAKGSAGAPARKVTMSVGISSYPDTSTGAADLLRHADLALLQAKKSGRNAVLLWGE